MEAKNNQVDAEETIKDNWIEGILLLNRKNRYLGCNPKFNFHKYVQTTMVDNEAQYVSIFHHDQVMMYEI